MCISMADRRQTGAISSGSVTLPDWLWLGPGTHRMLAYGLNEPYQKMAPEVYECNTRSTEGIRGMFQIKSQRTLYDILSKEGSSFLYRIIHLSIVDLSSNSAISLAN